MFNKFKNFYSNFGGWTTNRKIVVIESDDWGSIRMPSKEVYNYCIKNSYPVDKSIYTKYDSLASEEDLNLLLNLLVSKRNSYGQNPVFTINSLVANPDFGRIKQNNFQEYHYELITETFRKYPKHQRNWELWSQAASENLFYFQSHGREHLNVNRFLSDLRKGVKEAMFAFDLCMPGIFHLNNINEGNNYIVPFEFENDYDKIDKLHIVDEGLKLFEKLFGYKSVSFIAGNYVWYDEIEDALAKGGVKILQGSRFQLIPKGEYTGFVKKRNYLGSKNKYNQIYLNRNVFFEPCSNTSIDWVSKCVQEIQSAFLMKKPAIISTHRLNYVGYLDEKNRDHSLQLLEKLLSEILLRWPEVEFLNSVELGKLILNK